MLYLVSSINSIQITSDVRYVMSEHILVQSFELDGSSSTCGVPICASGKQPQVQQPDVYPDHLKTFVDQRELNSYFKKINSIFYVSHPRQDFHHFLSLSENRFPQVSHIVAAARVLPAHRDPAQLVRAGVGGLGDNLLPTRRPGPLCNPGEVFIRKKLTIKHQTLRWE